MRNNDLGFLIPFLFVAGGIGIVAVIWTATAYAARKRSEALQQVAEQLGFAFYRQAALTILGACPTFKLFSTGRRQTAFNLLTGATDTTQVMVFDWQYVTGSGKSTQTHTSTVVVIQSQQLQLPAFLCRPESVFDWIGLTFDGKDIDFADQPLFSKKFHLHGVLERQIRELFDAEVCEFFTQQERPYAEGQGEWLLYCHQEKIMPPDKVRDLFAQGFQLHVLLKRESGQSQTSRSPGSDEGRDEMSTEPE